MTNLQELSPVIQTLNEQSNKINEVIADLNAKLATLNIGLSLEDSDGPTLSQTGWVVERSNNGTPVDRTRESCYLGYTKLNEQWQLAVVKCSERQEYTDSGTPQKAPMGYDEVESYNIDLIPLLQSSRDLRISALANVKELLHVLQIRAEIVIQTIQEARAFADKL